MNTTELKQTAEAIVAPGRGILAADESTGTAGKRLAGIGMENTEDNRRAMREMFFTTPGAAEFISGVILYDETLRQSASDGKMFVDDMRENSVFPGIKVDEGLVDFGDGDGEMVTTGLDGLPSRLPEYYDIGARFAKWRAVFRIAEGQPTDALIEENATRLAKYAKLCQENGLVPIVEPEVLMDAPGANHDMAKALEVTTRVHKTVFAKLQEEGVYLEGILLKPSMIVPGKEFSPRPTVTEVADATVECLKASVPDDVPGIIFLSGGQGDIDATAHLNAMNAGHKDLPWRLSFSYGRALQGAALTAWGGKPENVAAAQNAFLHRARCNGLATRGEWNPSMEEQQSATA